MLIRLVKDTPTNNILWEYLTKENIKYTSHTFENAHTTYKIYTEMDNQMKKIDEILGGKNQWI